jgi:uncharacterized protein YcbK (DUF882 family)
MQRGVAFTGSMTTRKRARARTRRTLRPTAVGLVVVTASIVATLVHQPASSSAPSFSEVHRGLHRGATTEADGVVTEADGALPDGVTVFDDEFPGVAKLDADLLEALREATKDAAHDRVVLYVTSGWRSPRYQEQLLDDAISKYGSKEKAARWVGTPTTSAHVSGNAVDIAHADATAWLSKHGARYGLCQIYSNEPWHYELRPHAIDRGCPPMYADPTQDPRMQQ